VFKASSETEEEEKCNVFRKYSEFEWLDRKLKKAFPG